MIRVLKFTSETCSMCAIPEKNGFYAEWKAANPKVTFVDFVCADKAGNSPKGTSYETASKLSDKLGVKGFPTYIFEVKGAGEVVRFDGAGAKGAMRKAFDNCLKECEEMIESLKALGDVPW